MNRSVGLGFSFSLTDFYCGAGGSSTGAEAAGAEVQNAANHWDRAIETHQRNHPFTRHYLTDLLEAHPSEFPRTPVAWFSPECRTHSRGRGKSVLKPTEQLSLWGERDPSEVRSRTTMEQVVEFTAYHLYDAVIVENVVDIKYWPPLSRWFREMDNLGYDHCVCYLNSMFFHPLNGQSDFAPQNRDRWYAVFWRRGNQAPDLDHRPLAWCERCGGNVRAVQTFKRRVFPQGLYDTTGKRGQYYYACPRCRLEEKERHQPGRVEPYYFAAWNAVDWSIPVTRIGDRERPLRPNTIRRIEIGLERYGRQPLVAELAYSHARNDRTRPASLPMPTQTSRQTLAFIVPMKADPRYVHAFPASKPASTLTTAGAPALLVEMYGGGDCRPVTDPANTVTSGGTKSGLLLLSADGMPGAGPADRGAVLVMPQTPFIVSYYGEDTVAPASAPIGTVTTVDRHAFVVNMQAGNGPTPIEGPLATVLTGNHKYLARPGNPPVRVEDCGFRMFEPNECQDAQGFPVSYDVLGNKREKVRQIGAAVTPPVAEFLVRAVRDSLEHTRKEKTS